MLFLFFVRVFRAAVRVAEFIAVLCAEGVERVREAVDHAGGGFFGAGAGDGEDGDVGFVFEAAVELGPFVVVGYGAEEGFFGRGFAEDLGAGVGAGADEVLEGAGGWGGEGEWLVRGLWEKGVGRGLPWLIVVWLLLMKARAGLELKR